MVNRAHSFVSVLIAALLTVSCGGGNDETPASVDKQARALSAGVATPPAPVLTGSWTQLPNTNYMPPLGPYSRAWTEMTWDSNRKQMVIFGGNTYVEYGNDIWAYDDNTGNWTEIEPNDFCPGNHGFRKPNGTDDTAFRYDPVNNIYWVFGVVSGYRCLHYATVRTAAAGTDSTTIVDPILPGTTADAYQYWHVRVGGVMAAVSGYDPAAKRLTLATPLAGLAPGGSYQLLATTTGGVWYFDPATRKWTGQDTPYGNTGITPSGSRIAPGVAYSSAAEAFVLFAGKGTGAPDTRVWRLDVRTKLWTQLPQPAGGTPPHARELLNNLVYDKANDVFILFGGTCLSDSACTDGSKLGQTWAYKLSTNTWTNMNPANGPSPRSQHLMAYDESNGVVTLFGGAVAGGMSDETWYYHYPSNSWTQVHAPAKPPARWLSQVVYNPVSKRTVIYSGATVYGMMPDIWALSLNAPPVVALTSPTAGQRFSGPTDITLVAAASDPNGTVAKVEFFAGGIKLGQALSAPYTLQWQGVVGGTYALSVKATDDRGASTTSPEMLIQVSGSYVPPLVHLASLPGGGSYEGPANITLTANASAGDGALYKVEFFNGATKIGESTSSPFSVTWIGVAPGTYPVTAVATDVRGVRSTSPAVTVTVREPPLGQVNLALQSNGGVATASSTYSSDHGASSVIDGNRRGNAWGSGGGWNDATPNAGPDWVQVQFAGSRSIRRINVVTLSDNFATDAEPTVATTFALYGITHYDVQYWTGSAWATVPGGAVSNNNRVWRTFTFDPITTDRIRVVVNSALAGYSRIVEIEAFGGGGNAAPAVSLTAPAAGRTFTAPAAIVINASASDSDGSITKVEFFAGGTKLGEATSAPYSITWSSAPAGSYNLTAMATDNAGAQTTSSAVAVTVEPASGSVPANVALAVNGGIATASSTYSAAYGLAGLNDGVRHGRAWASGGGWNDATIDAFPDSAQITFSGSKTIGRIDVVTLSDNFATDAAPSASTGFTRYGITAFEVQYWTGSTWSVVPGGSVIGNTLVARSFTFTPITTDRIRVVVTGALASYSRIVEIEAWTTGGGGGNAAPTVALTSPISGTSYTAPASVMLTSAASDADGSVTKVEFFANGSKLGEATSPPFSLNWSATAAGSYTVIAVATDNAGAQTTSAAVVVTVLAPGGATRINVAARANGGVASASSAYSAAYGVLGLNDGVRHGRSWASGGGWNDATIDAFPDIAQVNFSASQTINRIDVVTLSDNFATDPEPTATTAFTTYGITAFEVQYWTGNSWAVVPGGSVTDNALVIRTFTFAPLTTDRLRIVVSGAKASYSRIVEIEAWTGS